MLDIFPLNNIAYFYHSLLVFFVSEEKKEEINFVRKKNEQINWFPSKVFLQISFLML